MISNDKNNPTGISSSSSSSSQSNSTLFSLILRYFQRSSSKQSSQKTSIVRNEGLYFIQNITPSCHAKRATVTNNGMISNTSVSVSNHRPSRQTTTATFTGQKRYSNDTVEDSHVKIELSNIQEEEQQQLARTRVGTRTSSLPGARCISYYYYQNQIAAQAKTLDDQHNSRINSLKRERNRSYSQSSSPGNGNGNGGIAATDLSEHSSSFENVFDHEHRPLNRRNQPSRLSASYNSSRCSQRAVIKFMHERNKARLRRNQKASRMLGKINDYIILNTL